MKHLFFTYKLYLKVNAVEFNLTLLLKKKSCIHSFTVRKKRQFLYHPKLLQSNYRNDFGFKMKEVSFVYFYHNFTTKMLQI